MIIIGEAIDGAAPLTVGDSWLAALAGWSTRVLGPEWKVHTVLWPENLDGPAMLWKLMGMEVRPLGPVSFEVRCQMSAWVRGQDAQQEQSALAGLLEALGLAVKVPLDEAKRTYMRIVEPKLAWPVDQAAEEAAASGRLNVTLVRRMSGPVQEAPLMQYVHYQSKMR
ncbi:hypothetical protein [Paenibacillus sanguinis]|uniref:hypothetical protein n=1 Tax=Paenibacillus sanguinis TaxID=225906 RepID=UPI00036E787C|nr:hypothetical protein [Paenibacillus sanguinis]